MDSFIPLEKLPYPCLKQVKSDRYFLKKTFCWKLGVLPSSGFLSPVPGRPAEPEAGKQVLQRLDSGHPQQQKHGEQGTEGRRNLYLYLKRNMQVKFVTSVSPGLPLVPPPSEGRLRVRLSVDHAHGPVDA